MLPSYFFLLLVFLIIVDFILCCDLLSIYCAAVVLALCAVLLLFMTVFLVMLLHSGFFSHHRVRTKTVARMRLFCINKKLFLRIFFSHFFDCLVKRHFVYWNLLHFVHTLLIKNLHFVHIFLVKRDHIRSLTFETGLVKRRHVKSAHTNSGRKPLDRTHKNRP